MSENKIRDKVSISTANLTNLTSLWKTVGAPSHSFFKNPVFQYCEIQNSDWPNRFWFNHDPTVEELQTAIENLQLNVRKLLLVYWDIYGTQSYSLIEKMGFKLEFEQIGMSLKLRSPFVERMALNMKIVTDEPEAKVWEETYKQAFGYRINRNILLNSLKDVTYYLAYHQNQPVGTAIVFNTNQITGIHGIGVIHEARRKGYAEEIMKRILNKSLSTGHKYATLQASSMGRNLYLKLGFEEDFLMKNYSFNPQAIKSPANEPN